MIRIGICDDNCEFLQQIKHLIDHWNHPPQSVTAELFEDGDALILAHTRNPFDIILLDIVMPMLNGLETARELRQEDKNVKLVFLTSSAEYAVDSYAVKASNYLLKPVVPARLYSCLEELIAEVTISSKCLIVRGLDATHRLPLSAVEFIESQRKHIIFYTTEGKIIYSTDPLYTYEDTLTWEDGFFKCHRSYIVNIHHIDNYTHSEVVMRSGHRIPISRSNQKLFDDMYFRFIFEKAGG